MIILSDIFWFFGFAFFINLFGLIFNFKKVNYAFEWFFKFKEVTGRKPTRHEFRNDRDYNLFTNRSFIGLFEFIWILFGILTSQWLFFSIILIVSLLIKFGLEKWRFSKIDYFVRYLFVIFRCFAYLIMIINHFHF